METLIFHSLSDPVPPLRQDLDIFPFEQDGEELLAFRDPAGYGKDVVAFHPDAWALFTLFDGVASVIDLRHAIFEQTKIDIPPARILDIAQTLDRHLFLFSPYFIAVREAEDRKFRLSRLRHAAHSGASYSSDPAEVTRFFEELFLNGKEAAPHVAPEGAPLKGIIAPHIDLRIGPQVYVPPYRRLLATQADTFVILGTSHYSAEDMFILTEKDFETPMGAMETDKEFVRTLHRHSGNLFTRNDTAHRLEHSIEFQTLFLRHLFGGKNKRIVPILVTSFEEFLEEDTHPNSSERYRAFLQAFHHAVDELQRNVVFILSVDWSHVGMKFGDSRPASELLPETEISDKRQLEALTRADYEAFRRLLVANRNETRIDGFSCITTFFDLVRPAKGELLAYDQWHEEERASGVTFAGMAFY